MGDTDDLLYRTRMELARRGDPTWAHKLAQIESIIEDGGGLQALDRMQRNAVRVLMRELGYRARPSLGHGDGTDMQKSGCMCACCDPRWLREAQVIPLRPASAPSETGAL